MVDLQAIVAFNAAAIILLSIILVNAHSSFHFESTDNRLFLLMIFCTMAQAIIETVSFFTVEVHFSGSYWFNVAISALLFINNAMFAFLWVMYVDMKLFGDVQRLKKRYVIIGIPALIVIILSIVNLFCPVFFSADFHYSDFHCIYSGVSILWIKCFVDRRSDITHISLYQPAESN